MNVPLRVLIVEDSEDDAELVLRVLRRGGYEPVWQRVETADEMTDALRRNAWDLVIADYAMPHFGALSALWVLKEQEAELPCVIVSGAISEQIAVSCMKAGADDYLLKDNLSRLVPAVRRELRDAEQRRRLRTAERHIRSTEEQFRLAHEIQAKLFPAAGPHLPGYDIDGISYPAEATSGDYYDYVTMLDGSLGIVVADVSSHGFGPALLMAETRAYLRALAETHTDVSEIVTRMNRLLSQDVRDGQFVTLFLARLDPGTGTLVYASAGHRSYHLDAEGHETTLNSTGLVLGLLPGTVFETAPPLSLKPGELVLLMTDGIPETLSPQGELFGVPRALDVVRAHHDQPARAILDALYAAVRTFTCNQPQTDDITAVIVKVRK